MQVFWNLKGHLEILLQFLFKSWFVFEGEENICEVKLLWESKISTIMDSIVGYGYDKRII